MQTDIVIADGLTFSPATHTYRHRGQIIPSVTQILQLAGIEYEPVWNRDIAHLRGEEGDKVHRACELLDQGKLRWESVHPALRAKIEAYQIAKEKYEITIEGIEEYVSDLTRGFAGRLDRRVTITHPKHKIRVRAVADLKQAKELSAGIGIQLAGYALAESPAPSTRLALPGRLAIHLRVDDDGRPNPSCVWYEDETDYSAFLGALAVARWKLAHRHALPNGLRVEG